MRAVRVRRAGSERHAGMYGFGTVDSDQMLSKLKEDLDNELVYLRRAKDTMQQYASEVFGNINDLGFFSKIILPDNRFLF